MISYPGAIKNGVSSEISKASQKVIKSLETRAKKQLP